MARPNRLDIVYKLSTGSAELVANSFDFGRALQRALDLADHVVLIASIGQQRWLDPPQRQSHEGDLGGFCVGSGIGVMAGQLGPLNRRHWARDHSCP
jgi:hypothetical protein